MIELNNTNMVNLRHTLRDLYGIANGIIMSKKSNFFIGYNIRTITLAISMITITFIAMMGVIIFTNGQSINAQMMTGNRDGFGNMNTSLIQAMTTAEESVGNNSFAIAAFGENHGGYIVYNTILGTPGTEFYSVTVDPGNGQVLETQVLSQKELEKGHLEHSQKVLKEPHLMNDTFLH